jgi:hypothetical protein
MVERKTQIITGSCSLFCLLALWVLALVFQPSAGWSVGLFLLTIPVVYISVQMIKGERYE